MKTLSFLILCGVMVGPVRVNAENNESLFISQIQVSGPAGANDEFIEIFNPNQEIVNLSGWSVQYKSSTGVFPLTAKKVLPDFDLLPKRYFLIGHNAYSGTVPADLTQSSIGLSGSAAGATVYLSKSTDYLISASDLNIVDRVGYGTGLLNDPETSNAPLPEAGKSLIRKSDTGNNLLDFEVVDSGPRNSTFVDSSQNEVELTEDDIQTDSEEAVNDSENEQVQDVVDNTNESQQDGEELEEATQETVAYATGIIISEVMPNPEGVDLGEEWIELYNNSDTSINLEGWILDDSITDTISAKYLELGDFQIEPNEYLVVLIPEGRFTLNNTNDERVRLFWPDKKLVDEVNYSGTVKEEQTWCLINNDFQWCKSTPSKVNAVIPTIKTTSKKAENKENEYEERNGSLDYFDYQIKIISLLPNPEGADSGNEIIKLVNIGTEVVDIQNWILDDGAQSEPIGSSAYAMPASKLNIGEELEVQIPIGKFAMNNSGSDTVRLFSPDNKIRDFVTYSDPEEGSSYIKSGNEWSWSGEVLGTSSSKLSAEDALPRTGLNIHMFSFAGLLAICYIVYGFRIKKGIHEQTRSHRCLSS